MPTEPKADKPSPMALTGMNVDDNTRRIYRYWKRASKRSNGPLFQQLVIFAFENNFNPNTASLDWPSEPPPSYK